MSATLSVQEYIDKHDLSKKVEEAINQTVKVKPDEPLSYMVRRPVPKLCSEFNFANSSAKVWSGAAGVGNNAHSSA